VTPEQDQLADEYQRDVLAEHQSEQVPDEPDATEDFG
jgi:hypothetical protein